MGVRSTPHRAQWATAARQAKRPIAVPAPAAQTTTVLRQQTPPARGEGQQADADGGPGGPWFRAAEHAVHVAQVGLHAFPQNLAQPLVHLAPPVA